jgi:hypothetical protein
MKNITLNKPDWVVNKATKNFFGKAMAMDCDNPLILSDLDICEGFVEMKSLMLTNLNNAPAGKVIIIN